MKRILVFSLLCMLLLAANPCWGDVIEPGTKEIPLYYQIENIDNYPEYFFLAHGIPSPSFEVLNSSEFSFYKLSMVYIYALPESEFNPVELENEDDSQINAFFQNDSRLIKSNLELSGTFDTVPESDKLEKAVMILEIDSLNDTELIISKKQMKYYFTDGTQQVMDFQNQENIPQPLNAPEVSEYLLYILLPLLALGVIIFIIWKRK